MHSVLITTLHTTPYPNYKFTVRKVSKMGGAIDKGRGEVVEAFDDLMSVEDFTDPVTFRSGFFKTFSVKKVDICDVFLYCY